MANKIERKAKQAINRDNTKQDIMNKIAQENERIAAEKLAKERQKKVDEIYDYLRSDNVDGKEAQTLRSLNDEELMLLNDKVNEAGLDFSNYMAAQLVPEEALARQDRIKAKQSSGAELTPAELEILSFSEQGYNPAPIDKQHVSKENTAPADSKEETTSLDDVARIERKDKLSEELNKFLNETGIPTDVILYLESLSTKDLQQLQEDFYGNEDALDFINSQIRANENNNNLKSVVNESAETETVLETGTEENVTEAQTAETVVETVAKEQTEEGVAAETPSNPETVEAVVEEQKSEEVVQNTTEAQTAETVVETVAEEQTEEAVAAETPSNPETIEAAAEEQKSEEVAQNTTEEKADSKTVVSANDTKSYDPIHDEKAPINRFNALEVVKKGKMNTMAPSELMTLKRALNAHVNDQTEAAGKKLDSIVIQKAKDYNNGKLIVPSMEETYAFNNLLDMIKVGKQDADLQELNDAYNKTESEITAFEEQYGLDAAHLQTSETVEKNIEALDKLPTDKELFAHDIKPEKLITPTNYQDVVGILKTAKEKNSVPEISVLAGALQCKELDDEQKQTLLGLAQQRLGMTNALSHKDFANYEFLLKSLEQSPDIKKSFLDGKSKFLADARNDYKAKAPLKNKEFQDIYNVLDNLTVGGKLQAFNRETVDQKGADSDIALFMDTVRRETEMYLANTSKEITHEAFAQEYADRLRNNLVQLAFADQVTKGQVSQKDFGKMFDDLAKSAENNKKLNINQDTFLGYQAAKTARMESAINVLGTKEYGKATKYYENGLIKQKTDYQKASQSFGSRIQNLDQKLTKKYGKPYSMLKGMAKSASWGLAFSLAGASLGPAGVAVVATASFANQAYGMFKDFKKQKQSAKEQGQKLTFWSYVKNNKARAAGMVLSAATVAISGVSAAGIASQHLLAIANTAKAASGIGLATSGAFHQAAQAYRQTEGSKGKKRWAAIKSFGASTLAFGAGMLAGRAAGEMAVESYNNIQAEPAITTTDVSNEGQAFQPNRNWQVQMPGENGLQNGIPDVTPPLAPEAQVETPAIDGGELEPAVVTAEAPTPTIDVNNLSADQQHDIKMLFLRSPAEANAILGGDWKSSAELQAAWDNGELTTEQKVQLTEFAGQRFDDHGHFQDVEGYTSAAQMEADAKTYTAAQQTKVETQNTTAEHTQTTAAEQAQTLAAGQRQSMRPEMEPLARIDKDMTARAETTMNSTLETPDVERVSKVDINKIVNKGDEIKVVGTGPDGHRFSVRTDDEQLMDKMEHFDKVKYKDNGDVKVVGENQKVVVNEDGEYKSVRLRNGESVAKEDMIPGGNTPEHNKEILNDLQNTARDASLDELVAKQPQQEAPTPVKETPAPVKETPLQEQPSPVKETPTQETVTPVKETPVQETSAQTQETPAQETSAPAKETQGQEAAAAAASMEHTTECGVSYYVDENGALRISGRAEDISHLKASTYSVDKQGAYHIGDAVSKDLSHAQKIEDHNLRHISVNDVVYNDLQMREANGEVLHNVEKDFMGIHKQEIERYGLTHTEDGKLIRVDEVEKQHAPVQEQAAQARAAETVQKTAQLNKLRGLDTGRQASASSGQVAHTNNVALTAVNANKGRD